MLAVLLASLTLGQHVARIPIGKGPMSVAIADVDRDGHADLLVASAESGELAVLRGDGKGGFTPAPGSPFAAGRSPNDLAVADLDGDGRLDAVVANHDSQELTVLLGDGSGHFRPRAVPVRVKPHPHGVAVGDLDGDRKLDLVTDSWGEDKVELLRGDGKGGFTIGPRLATGKRPYQRVRVADLNGDGRADIVTTSWGGSDVTVLWAPGFRAQAFPAGEAPFFVAVGDLDGDGRPDLAVANYSGHITDARPDGVHLLLGDGHGRFAMTAAGLIRAARAPVALAIGDVTGDGKPDLVVPSLADGTVTVLAGPAFGAAAVLPVGGKVEGVAVGDLDGDGRADIAACDAPGNELVLFLSR